MPAPDTDTIDLIREQWAQERPELDSSAFDVVGRILLLGKMLEKRVAQVLAPLGLGVSSFDVLATLRRQGAPFELTPKGLSGATLLTSGTMTTRLDCLERDGFVVRRPDPNDGRGVVVALTKAGRRLADRAIEARLEEARDALEALGAKEQRQLTALLRPMLLDLDARGRGSD